MIGIKLISFQWNRLPKVETFHWDVHGRNHVVTEECFSENGNDGVLSFHLAFFGRFVCWCRVQNTKSTSAKSDIFDWNLKRRSQAGGYVENWILLRRSITFFDEKNNSENLNYRTSDVNNRNVNFSIEKFRLRLLIKKSNP